MINYLVGDATDPVVKDDIRIIAHITNNMGTWGAGFVVALSKKWNGPEERYQKVQQKLGDIQIVSVEEGLFVCNMCAQNNSKKRQHRHPVSYDSLDDCFSQLRESIDYATEKYSTPVTLHMPRIGCGIGGGTWSIIEALINQHFSDLDVYVYDFEDKTAVSYIPFKP